MISLKVLFSFTCFHIMDYLFTLFTLFTIFTSYDKVSELEMHNKNYVKLRSTRINKKISLLFIDFYFILLVN